jgi:hypothetical protein
MEPAPELVNAAARAGQVLDKAKDIRLAEAT